MKHDDDFSSEIVNKLVKAARQKEAGAQFLLSAALEMGVGVDVDLIESRAWLEVAVSQNPPYGKRLIEQASVLLDGEDVVKAMGRASELRKKYTNLYDNPATVIIGDAVGVEE